MDHVVRLPAELCANLLDPDREFDEEEEDMQALWDVLSEETEEMARYIEPYLTLIRGTIGSDVAITPIEDDGIIFDPGLKTGHIYIEFDEESYMGCRDLDQHETRQPQIPFVIDYEAKTMTLKFLDPQERDPDEY